MRATSEDQEMHQNTREFELFKMLVTLGGIPQISAMVVGIAMMLAIFTADILTGATLQLHLLFVFPLAVGC